MKTLKHIFIACCMVYTASCGIVHLASCTAPVPTPKPPNPPIVQPPSGKYIIMEFDAPGHVKHTWYVTTFKETNFPRSVTFQTEGRTVTLHGSYEIDAEE
jgi:hypothetical protein